MVYRFTSGLLGLDKKRNNDDSVLRVLKCECRQVGNEGRRRIALLLCLYEYGQEKEFTRQELTTNRDNRYWERTGSIGLEGATDREIEAVAMLVELTAIPSSSPPLRSLDIRWSLLTPSALKTLLPVSH